MHPRGKTRTPVLIQQIGENEHSFFSAKKPKHKRHQRTSRQQNYQHIRR
jgi:hypothetical protein